MTPPPLTVLISVYNGAATLNGCFESIQKQVFQDFEIVCINDGSTDQTSEIIKKWQTIFVEKLQIIENKQSLGLTSSLKRGLENIQTKFTARIDADDWWHPEKLAKQMAFLETHSAYGLIGCNYKNIRSNVEKNVYCKETDNQIKKSIFQRNPFAHSCVVFDTALIKKIDGYDESIRYGQDYDLWLRLLPHTKFHNLQEFLCYRNAASGISQEKQSAQMYQCIRTQLKYLKLYNRPVVEYRFIIEPFLVAIAPEWLRTLKRKFF